MPPANEGAAVGCDRAERANVDCVLPCDADGFLVGTVICPVHRGGRESHLGTSEIGYSLGVRRVLRAGSRSALPLRFSVVLRVRRVDFMSKKHRSFLLASLLPAFLLGSVFAVVQAQNAGAPAIRQTRWSDPATWPDGQVPAAGDKVTIAKGKDVLLDVSPPALGGLTIDGKLSFANNADLELTTEWIMLHGELEIGTEASPTRARRPSPSPTTSKTKISWMGGANDRSDRGIMLMGGTLNLHGDRNEHLDQAGQTPPRQAATRYRS